MGTLRSQLLPPKKAAVYTKQYGVSETAIRNMLKKQEIPDVIYTGTKALINMGKLFDCLGIVEECTIKK